VANQFRANADVLSPPRQSQQTDGGLRDGSVAATATRVTIDQTTAASLPVEIAERHFF
jgi:hypothetical protein